MKHDHFTDEKIPMTTDLKVPFTEKEHAKALGARWDADRSGPRRFRPMDSRLGSG